MITQEFSLAVFSLTLKQSIIVQGVKIRLYVIQFTRYRTRFPQEAFGLYHVQNRLSRTFFKFFRTYLIGFSPRRPRRQLG